MKILDLNNIQNIIKNEKLEVCVISYGGSGSNILVDTLEKNNYICRTESWNNILCHSPTLINIDIPIIYIYRDPKEAFLSMKKRGIEFWGVNQQKLSNNLDIKLTDENLLVLMIKQFYNFTEEKKDNILIIKYTDLFQHNILDKLKIFLNNKNLKYFPIEYIKSKNNIKDIEENVKILFQYYQTYIDYINNYDVKK